MSVSILLADDHPLIRRGLRTLLEGEPDLSVAGEAEDGIQVLMLAERMHPDVMIVDMMMPNLNGLEVIKEVRRRLPCTRLIVLSMQSADPYVVEAFRAGASGYVLKDGAPGEVVKAIRTALAGDLYLSPKLPDRLAPGQGAGLSPGKRDAYDSLTEREREVFQMAAEGKTAAEIASILCISPRTVELHRSRMMSKLGIRSQTELVLCAVRRGILATEN
jgi:two-component system response regulator NreC